MWVINIWITEGNAEKIVRGRRFWWMIEKKGGSRQKHWQGNIGHAGSWNEKAQINNYLLEQVAEFMKQLYKHYFLQKKLDKETLKYIL